MLTHRNKCAARPPLSRVWRGFADARARAVGARELGVRARTLLRQCTRGSGGSAHAALRCGARPGAAQRRWPRLRGAPRASERAPRRVAGAPRRVALAPHTLSTFFRNPCNCFWRRAAADRSAEADREPPKPTGWRVRHVAASGAAASNAVAADCAAENVAARSLLRADTRRGLCRERGRYAAEPLRAAGGLRTGKGQRRLRRRAFAQSVLALARAPRAPPRALLVRADRRFVCLARQRRRARRTCRRPRASRQAASGGCAAVERQQQDTRGGAQCEPTLGARAPRCGRGAHQLD